MRAAHFKIEEDLSRPDFLVIRDLGPHDQYLTVTNAAESVVQSLAQDGLLPAGRRLFYFDTDHRLNEIVVEDGEFAGFRHMRQEGSAWGQSYIDADGREVLLIGVRH